MINKSKNMNLQITLSKADYERLLTIQNELSIQLSIDLNKSQVIGLLLRNYHGQEPNKPTAPKQNKKVLSYQSQVLALKDKLNVSYTHLSEIIGIPASTLKKYANVTSSRTAEMLSGRSPVIYIAGPSEWVQ